MASKVEKNMTFYKWIKRFKKDNHRFGDLTRDIYSDNDALVVRNYFKSWKDHLNQHDACSDAHDVLKEMWVYYKEYKLQIKLKSILRNRLSSAIRYGNKNGSAVRDLGCSIEELKKHIESQFKEGMSWSNYGLKGWHIDHIYPLSRFDLTKKENILKACHYTNLQPLWAVDNIRKGNKIVSI